MFFLKQKLPFHFEKLRPIAKPCLFFSPFLHVAFCVMQKGNRVPCSAYHEWHHLPPLQNYQSRCQRSCHHIRRADRLLGPPDVGAPSLRSSFKNSGSTLSTGANSSHSPRWIAV